MYSENNRNFLQTCTFEKKCHNKLFCPGLGHWGP